jgi:adenylate cyclase
MVKELRLKERIKDTFGKYLDPRVVVKLIDSPEGVIDTTGEKRVMTIFFSDIAGFTPIGEALTPDALVRLINEYFTQQAIPIQQRKGIIDKFIGDSVMAFWGPPFTQEDEHARLACLSALDQREQLEEFRLRLPDLMGLRKGLPDINFRIGIATGEVVVGNIGSELSKSYTVMGDTVNLASRLEGANKHYGTRFLISENTQKMVGRDVETREIDLIQVVGKSEPVRVFELLARKGELKEKGQKLRALFHQGLEAYRTRDWKSATRQFKECLELAPEDPPAQVFLKRVDHLRENPPSHGWDGVWRFTHK